MKTEEIITIKLIPDSGKYLKRIATGEIFNGTLYLGKNDSPDNYSEANEEEYQAYLGSLESTVEE